MRLNADSACGSVRLNADSVCGSVRLNADSACGSVRLNADSACGSVRLAQGSGVRGQGSHHSRCSLLGLTLAAEPRSSGHLDDAIAGWRTAIKQDTQTRVTITV